MPANRSLLTYEHRDAAADVLVVTNAWPHEGNTTYGIFVKRQVDSLLERGLHCDVLFMRGFTSAAAYARGALHLAREQFPSRYRLVHAQGGETGAAAAVYRRAPLVVSYHGSDLLGIWREGESLSSASRIRRAAVRESARAAARTITQSREMEEALPPRVRKRNSVIPNGVDTRLFRPLDRAESRRALGWPEDEEIVLFAGKPQAPVKRVELAKEVCHRAGARLEIAWGLPPEQVPLVMNAADCLLLTSRAEGSPNVVKEAVLCGLPVVTTRVGDVEEVLAGVEPTWICSDDPGELARALTDCLGRRERSNGPAVARRLSLDSVAERLLAVYEEVSPGLA